MGFVIEGCAFPTTPRQTLRSIGRDSALELTIEVVREVRDFNRILLATSVRDHSQHPKHLVRLVKVQRWSERGSRHKVRGPARPPGLGGSRACTC